MLRFKKAALHHWKGANNSSALQYPDEEDASDRYEAIDPDSLDFKEKHAHKNASVLI